MKTTVLIHLLILGTGFQSCESSTTEPDYYPGEAQFLSGLPEAGTLSDQDKPALTFMREEEKLARDVYSYFYTLYGLDVFSSISSSEQRHTDAILVLLNRYNLPDPAAGAQPGVFQDPDLAALYEALTVAGSKSLPEALKAGLLIEETDIADLDNRFSTTTAADLLWVKDNLTRGSRNHIRGFYQALEVTGEKYTPSILSEEVFQSILSTPVERGGRRR